MIARSLALYIVLFINFVCASLPIVEVVVGDSVISDEFQADFKDEARDILKAVKEAWEKSAECVKFTSMFLISPNQFPSNEEFQRFTSHDTSCNTGEIIQRIQWVPEVSSSGRERFENLTGKHIFALNSAGTHVPKGAISSAIYYPIQYCSPPQEALIGLDLSDGAQGNALDAIRRAKASGLMTATDPYRISSAAGAGFLMTIFVPVFAGAASSGSAALTAQRTERLAGCVAAVVPLQALLAAALMPLNLSSIDAFLFANGARGHFRPFIPAQRIPTLRRMKVVRGMTRCTG
jgi:CHASE1-domain containing sensor protein